MKWHRRISAACVGAMLIASSAAQAQETLPVSYSDLAQRVQQLEERQAELERMPGVELASYNSSLGFSDGQSGCGGCCCCGVDGYYALYENVVVIPHYTRNFAFLVEDTNGPSDLFEEISFDGEVTYSPRLEFGRMNGCGGLGWRIRYWHLDSEATETRSLLAGQTAYAGFGGSDGADVEFDQSGPSDVTARHELRLNVLDLEATKQHSNAIYGFGFRFADMEQQYVIFSPTDDGILGQHDFKGAGPTLAGEWYHMVGCKLSVFAKARGSILFGESTLYATDVADGASSDVIYRSNDFDMLTIGEIQLGVDWRTNIGCSDRIFFVTAAVEAQAWLNAGSGSPGVLDDDDGNYQDEAAQSSDMGVIGATIGTGVIF